MKRPMLVSENSRSVLVEDSPRITARKLPQFIAAFLSTLPAVCLGMVFSWTSPATTLFEKEFGMSQSESAWVGSLGTLGAFVGALPTGALTKIIGRKKTLLMLVVPLFISWIIIGYFYRNLVVLYIARFIAGISCGGISVAAPLYVSEIAHISIRGTLGTFFQVQLTIGILLEYSLGEITTDIKTLSIVSSVLPVLFLLTFAVIPESPVFYCERSELAEAQKSLAWFRGNEYEVEDEIVKITEEIKEGTKNKMNFFDLFNSRATLRGIVVSFGLMIFQQLSGVNAVLFYSNTIFQQSDGTFSPGTCCILLGLVQVIATLSSTVFIDKAGRKILLILSDFVMCISLASLGVYLYLNSFMDLHSYSLVSLTSLAVFIIFFSLGFGPIPWMIVGEIFLPHVKSVAGSASASLNWILAFIVTNQFNNLNYYLGIGWTFILFSVICGLGTLFVIFVVPETKGRSVEEVVASFDKRCNSDNIKDKYHNYDKNVKTTTVV